LLMKLPIFDKAINLLTKLLCTVRVGLLAMSHERAEPNP